MNPREGGSMESKETYFLRHVNDPPISIDSRKRMLLNEAPRTTLKTEVLIVS